MTCVPMLQFPGAALVQENQSAPPFLLTASQLLPATRGQTVITGRSEPPILLWVLTQCVCGQHALDTPSHQLTAQMDRREEEWSGGNSLSSQDGQLPLTFDNLVYLGGSSILIPNPAQAQQEAHIDAIKSWSCDP